MTPLRYAVIDTETTGLDPLTDHVVSVAVVPVQDGAIRMELAQHRYVNPGVLIPAETTAVHGITDADVSDAGDLASALAAFAPLLADRVIVGHNLAFDVAFLAKSGLTTGPTLDTLAVSRLLWRKKGTRHSLDATAARVGVVPSDRHTALGDAIATAEVLLACLPLLAAKGLETPAAVAAAYDELLVRRARLRRSIHRRSIRPRRRRRWAQLHR